MSKLKKWMSVLLISILLVTPISFAPAASAAEKGWTGTWSTSPVMLGLFYRGTKYTDFLSGCSVRTVIKTTTGGEKVRLSFSNRYGSSPLNIESVRIARTGKMSDTEIIDGTSLPVTFKGAEAISIPAGEEMDTDPIDMVVENFEKISVSVYYSSYNALSTGGLINSTSYLDLGNKVDAKTFSANAPLTIVSGSIEYHTTPFLCEMDVYGENKSSVVLFGDSTLANNSPYYLAEKMHYGGEDNVGVLQEAIIGNKLMTDSIGATNISHLYGDAGIARFQNDVLKHDGIKAVFVKIGLNDVLHQFSKSMSPLVEHVTVSDIIGGYTKLVNMAHEKGIKIYFFSRQAWKGYQRVFYGSDGMDLVWSQKAEDMLIELNQWLQFSSGADGYISVDSMRDKQDSTKMADEYVLDGAHLTDLGAQTLVDLIPTYMYGLDSAPSIVEHYANGGKPIINYTPADRYTVYTPPTATVPAADNQSNLSAGSGSASSSDKLPVVTTSISNRPAATVTMTEIFLVEMTDPPTQNSIQPSDMALEHPASPDSLSDTARFGVAFFTFLTICAVTFCVFYFLNKRKSED